MQYPLLLQLHAGCAPRGGYLLEFYIPAKSAVHQKIKFFTPITYPDTLFRADKLI